jgi:hypothetical protein
MAISKSLSLRYLRPKGLTAAIADVAKAFILYGLFEFGNQVVKSESD